MLSNIFSFQCVSQCTSRQPCQKWKAFLIITINKTDTLSSPSKNSVACMLGLIYIRSQSNDPFWCLFSFTFLSQCFSLDNFYWSVFKFVDSFLSFIQSADEPSKEILHLWCCIFYFSICIWFHFIVFIFLLKLSCSCIETHLPTRM